jgi:hypothetical protein
MRKTKRTTRSKTGRRGKAIALLAALLLAAFAQAQKKPEPYAVVRGSVFLDSGRTQPGAKVVLTAKAKPDKKLQEQISSPQGEFAFRVPPGPTTYILTATMKGFEPASKEVDVTGQEEINKTLLLVPASKK